MRISFIKVLYAQLLNVYFYQKHYHCVQINPEYFENDDPKDWSDVFPTTWRPVQRWNGTKPPFPRTTQEVCTKKFVVQFPRRVVQLKSGQRIIVRKYPIKMTKQMFAFPPRVHAPTLFELLDEIIYKSLDSPEPGYSENLMKKIDMFYYYLQLVKSMYIDKKEEKLEALRYSVYKLIVSRGGPTFTGYPISSPESKKKLSEAFNWIDKDFEVLRKRQKIVESTWYRVQMNIFDMNQLLQLREQINETKKITSIRPVYRHQPPRRWRTLE